MDVMVMGQCELAPECGFREPDKGIIERWRLG